MLLRTDPFRDLDRLTETVFGTTETPAGARARLSAVVPPS